MDLNGLNNIIFWETLCEINFAFVLIRFLRQSQMKFAIGVFWACTCICFIAWIFKVNYMYNYLCTKNIFWIRLRISNFLTVLFLFCEKKLYVAHQRGSSKWSPYTVPPTIQPRSVKVNTSSPWVSCAFLNDDNGQSCPYIDAKFQSFKISSSPGPWTKNWEYS